VDVLGRWTIIFFLLGTYTFFIFGTYTIFFLGIFTIFFGLGAVTTGVGVVVIAGVGIDVVYCGIFEA